MPYDVRAVRLIKSTADNPLLGSNFEKNPDYIVLGHFDFMHIESLNVEQGGINDSDPLKLIQQDGCRDQGKSFGCFSNNIYTLYMLRQIESEDVNDYCEKGDEFWKTKAICTAVVRIHCTYESKDKQILRKSLRDFLRNQISGKTNDSYDEDHDVPLTVKVNVDSARNDHEVIEKEVKCLIYDSLELSDCTVVMKSDSISAVLKVTHIIFQKENIRDTYTYIGIQQDLLKNNNADQIYTDVMGQIPYLTTRFSVRDTTCADNYFQNLNIKMIDSPTFPCVTGTADRVFHKQNISEYEFLKFLKILIELSPDSYKSFNDIITRIGIDPMYNGNSKKLERKQEHEKLEPVFQSGKQVMDTLRNFDWTLPVPNWVHYLVTMIGTLKSMKHNYVMDDLADLIIPGAEAFCQRLCSLLDMQKTTQEKRALIYGDGLANDIQVFLDGWNSLTQDISHLESQLTQHPELVPVRYYIPATILQFEQRFVEKCCDWLCESTDDQASRKFVPMLVPSGFRGLTTTAPLDPRAEEFDQNSPLIVYISIEKLYNPWFCAHGMVHEIAHYIGDEARKREKRMECLIKCSSYFLISDLIKLSSIPAERQNTDYDNAVGFLSAKIQKNVENLLEERRRFLQKRPYLSIICECINDCVFGFLCTPQFKYELIQKLSPTAIRDRLAVDEVSLMEEQCQSLKHYERFSNHLLVLKELAAECYSDLAMILLLNCSFSTYYDCIFKDQYCYLKEIVKDPNGIDRVPLYGEIIPHIMRMALVTAVMNNVIRSTKNHPLRNSWDVELQYEQYWEPAWCDYARQIAAGILSFSDTGEKNFIFDMLCDWGQDTSNVLSMVELKDMTDYLCACAKELEKQIEPQASGRDNVYTPTRILALLGSPQKPDSINWNGIQRFLLENRGPHDNEKSQQSVSNDFKAV